MSFQIKGYSVLIVKRQEISTLIVERIFMQFARESVIQFAYIQKNSN